MSGFHSDVQSLSFYKGIHSDKFRIDKLGNHGDIAVGLASAEWKYNVVTSLGCKYSWGAYHNSQKTYGNCTHSASGKAHFRAGDTVTITANMETNTMSVQVCGKPLNVCFTNLTGTLYFAVSMFGGAVTYIP